MKKPRLTDFQPKAKAVALSSPLDDMPVIEKPQAATDAVSTLEPVTKEQSSLHDDTSVTTPVRPYVRAPVRRSITRCSFELFQDQMEKLRLLSLQQKTEGEKGSMSEMVRDALDAYLLEKEGAE